MALSQLSKLLPLPEEELQQVLDYASTLSKQEAVEHFRNLLGDSPAAVDFISTFNSRRQDPKSAQQQPEQPTSQSDTDRVPKPRRGPRKKRPNLHTPAPRQITDFGLAPGTAYSKKDLENDYLGRKSASASTSRAPSRGVSPAKPSRAAAAPPKLPPSAAGQLISDIPKAKSNSHPNSRSSTPGPRTKINVTGGTAMHGASTALSDLDAAIRALELTTNPSKTADDDARRCNCVAARHPLLAAAPNCLNCGKVICVKEGLGPCTFCGSPLLSQSEVQSMIRELRSERGREKMAVDREVHRRPDISRTPAAFTKPRETPDDLSAAEARARENRDRLLGYQAQNATRTTVRDEAADFDVSGAIAGTGGNMWATPEERARELKKQQKILREMEWNARPDYEKRRQVVSIDLVGGKVVRKMAAMERPQSPEDEAEARDDYILEATSGNRSGGGGAFSRNPLVGGLIKPVYDAKEKGAELEGRKEKKTRWRKVQDDFDNNEDIILDGGAYGSYSLAGQGAAVGADEPACG